MAGNRAVGLKAAQKNKALDPDFYREIGRIGGASGNTGGFASDKIGQDGLTGRERARIVGAKGGRISKRRKSLKVN